MSDFEPLMGAGKRGQVLQEQQMFPTAEPTPVTPQLPHPRLTYVCLTVTHGFGGL